MRDDLLYHYERELTYLRRLGAEFAERYPKVAARLQLEATQCDDPHVERLLEGFAFLAARVHLKLEDDFPEVSEALLGTVYPHHVRPLPSFSTAQFWADPERNRATTGLRVPRGATLHARPVNGVRCAFRTAYDVTLWPLAVEAAQWTAPDALRPPVRAHGAAAALRLTLRCAPDVRFDALELTTLRLHLRASGSLDATLYELLCNNCLGVLVRDPARGTVVELPPSAIQPAGFGEDERLLPSPGHAFAAYGLLQEYFAFPEKYLYVDLSGFDRVREAGFGGVAEVVVLVAPFERADRRALETGVTAEAFRLGCTPVVNLFAQTSEPILLTQRRDEYELVADARRRHSTDVYSVDDVVAVTPGSSEPLAVAPLYGARRAAGGTARGRAQVYWHARRRAALAREDGGTTVALAFVDLSGRTVWPEQDAVTARLTCFNGTLAAQLPYGDERGDLELQGGGPFQKIGMSKPTRVVQPLLGKAVLWQLISQLSLNYLSIADGDGGPLRELLRLHNLADEPAAEKQIQGIVGVRGGPSYARVTGEYGVGFARGRRVEVDFDEEQFAGGGVFLFASVLERFLAQYAALNSFTALAARTRQRRAPVREWAPRAGCRVLV